MGQTEYRVENWDIMQHWMGVFNDHNLHGVLYFQGHLEEERLWGAIERSFTALPQLTCGFCEGKGRPRWKQGDFGKDDILRVVPAGDVEESLQGYLTDKLPEGGPQIKVTILRGIEGDTLCIVLTHMLTDGVGFKEYLYLLARLYSDDSVKVPAVGDRSARQVFRALTPRQRWEVVRRRYRLGSQKSELYFSLTGGDTPFVALKRIEASDFLRVRRYAKEKGATVNDILVTAYLRALGDTLGALPAALPCPVDLRKFLPIRDKAGFCNLTSFLFCDIEHTPGESFDKTLAKVIPVMAGQKDDISCLHATLLLELAFALLPYHLAIKELGRFFKNPPIAMTNIGVIDDKKLSFGGVEPMDAFVTGSIKYAPYFQLAVTTYKGRVTLSINFYGTKVDREKIDDFLQAVEAQMLGACDGK